jgi:hypothetical protein
MMIDYDIICFNIAAFIGGLFVLEFGADKFIDHTAKVASRLRISPTIIALLTAGAEWEEVRTIIRVPLLFSSIQSFIFL